MQKIKQKKSTQIFLTLLLLTMMGGAFLVPTKANSYLSDLNTRLLYLNTLYEPPVASQRAPVTAYSALDSCHHANCAMASGNPAYIGAVACPRHIPLFTRITINNQTYTCEDRTSTRYPDRFDIFMGYTLEDHQKAINFGIKKLIVSY